MTEPRCPACGGHGQAYAQEYDVQAKMLITIHLDNGCKPCRGTGLPRAYPIVVYGGGYRCGGECRSTVSLLLRAWRGQDGVRWVKYRCVTKGHEWDTTVIRQNFAAIAARMPGLVKGCKRFNLAPRPAQEGQGALL